MSASSNLVTFTFTFMFVYECAVSVLLGMQYGRMRDGAHFVKCFFLVWFSFWLQGVIMLSVGETYVG